MDSKENTIFAHEALIRSKPHVNPLTLFQDARENKRLYEFDTFCIHNAVKEYPSQLFQDFFLFINILPSTIIHPNFEEFIEVLLLRYSYIKGKVVFELSENVLEQNIWEKELFLKRLSYLQSLDFRIAFDDIPTKRLSFERINLHSPDYIKLDHTRAKGLSSSAEKQELISLFLEFAQENTKLVLEGIETKADLLAAKLLGVPLLQGYFISKPRRLSTIPDN
jgi:EAL domain-containing protein (putative c-di-GMP-specific phosphodiesterase class I)